MSSTFEKIIDQSNRVINTALDPQIGPSSDEGRERLAFQQRIFYNVALGSLWCMPRFLGWQPFPISIGVMARDIDQCRDPAIRKALPLVQKAFQTSVVYDALNQLGPHERHLTDGIINNHAAELKQNASALNPEEQLPLPIGTANHGMFLRAMCTIVNGVRSYQVKVYNSGEASSRQGSWATAVLPFAKVPTLVIEGIRPDAIEQSGFINALLWLKTQQGSPHQVYNILHSFLIQEGGGRVVADSSPASKHHTQGPVSEDCTSKCINFWLQETVGKVAYRNFKVARTEIAVARLRQAQAFEETYMGKRWFVNPHFLNRILYFLFNFIPISAQLTLAEGVLEKRKRKAEELHRAAIT